MFYLLAITTEMVLLSPRGSKYILIKQTTLFFRSSVSLFALLLLYSNTINLYLYKYVINQVGINCHNERKILLDKFDIQRNG